MRKVLLVAVAFVVVLPLAGCLPDNPIWPDGTYVHPQFVTATDSVANPGANACVVGMAWDLTVKAYPFYDYAVDPGSLEEWYNYPGVDIVQESADEADCLTAYWGPRRIYWTCNYARYGLTEYYWSHDPDTMRNFRLCNDCTTNGDLVWLGPYPCNTGPIPL